MKDLRLHYTAAGWLIDCPAAPTPSQMAWLRAWAVQPQNVQHILTTAGVADHLRANALDDLINGKIAPNVLGARMDGTGDLIAFQAKKPRERIYSIGA